MTPEKVSRSKNWTGAVIGTYGELEEQGTLEQAPVQSRGVVATKQLVEVLHRRELLWLLGGYASKPGDDVISESLARRGFVLSEWPLPGLLPKLLLKLLAHDPGNHLDHDHVLDLLIEGLPPDVPQVPNVHTGLKAHADVS